MRTRITRRVIEGMGRPTAVVKLHDAEARGLELRLYPSGLRVWSFIGRQRGRQRHQRIGEYPAVSVGQARSAVREIRRRLDGGEIPADDRRRLRSQPTVGDLWERYVAEVVPGKPPASRRNDVQWWERRLARPLGSRVAIPQSWPTWKEFWAG